MDNPITDSESLSEHEQSFEPDSDDSNQLSVTIVHHNGSEIVTDFDYIEEIRFEDSTIRVHYSDDEYTDYYGATVTEVSP